MHMSGLSHVDTDGKARMVDVSEKPDTVREAVARGAVLMRPTTLALIQQNAIQKGDVLSVAKIAGIMAAKRTAELIPLCHPLPLTNVELTFSFNAGRIEIESRARVTGKTGVEMEALSAVAVAALTVYDMCKAVDREMAIADIRLVEKRGGRSGTFRRPGEQV
jgi:cyclic pyranopterin phosphate synthase